MTLNSVLLPTVPHCAKLAITDLTPGNAQVVRRMLRTAGTAIGGGPRRNGWWAFIGRCDADAGAYWDPCYYVRSRRRLRQERPRQSASRLGRICGRNRYVGNWGSGRHNHRNHLDYQWCGRRDHHDHLDYQRRGGLDHHKHLKQRWRGGLHGHQLAVRRDGLRNDRGLLSPVRVRRRAFAHDAGVA